MVRQRNPVTGTINFGRNLRIRRNSGNPLRTDFKRLRYPGLRPVRKENFRFAA
jgi:hypothetical protein